MRENNKNMCGVVWLSACYVAVGNYLAVNCVFICQFESFNVSLNCRRKSPRHKTQTTMNKLTAIQALTLANKCITRADKLDLLSALAGFKSTNHADLSERAQKCGVPANMMPMVADYFGIAVSDWRATAQA